MPGNNSVYYLSAAFKEVLQKLLGMMSILLNEIIRQSTTFNHLKATAFWRIFWKGSVLDGDGVTCKKQCAWDEG